ncbi:hypothetical protein PF008_g25352 [Phytophthora fragariae]|uniref:GST N-terminal domain-containing protein n=1 Tax=Phytophthora fragariae TaxID=53985 RepID=A0A6G0QK78_9STRA|nr:hypothetical protein PF008_g25352 [Phytophthora fragariae]
MKQILAFTSEDVYVHEVANHPKVNGWYTLQNKLKLTYMPLPGRGEPICLALFIGGVEFEDERISREALANRKLPFNQLPETEKQLVMRAELASGMIAKTLGFLESRIVKYKGPYAATPTLTVADLAIYGVLVSLGGASCSYDERRSCLL